MQIVSSTYARNNFSELISQVRYNKQHFVVKKKNKIVAQIIPPASAIYSRAVQKKAKQAMSVLRENDLGVKNWPAAKKIIKTLHDFRFP